MVGIVSYGVYIPKYRLKTAEIAAVWGKEKEEVLKGLGVEEIAVPSIDEDTATLAYEAASSAVRKTRLKSDDIQAVFIGSESHPYTVNPTSTIIGEYLGINHNYSAADLEFACKAGTTAIQVIAGLLSMGKINYGLAIGADTAQAKPHDILEYTASAGGAAFILGKKPKEIVAELVDFTSFSSDTPDFWRRDGVSYPSHGGRFTGEPGYFAHTIEAASLLLKKLKMKAADFNYCVFHMPNGKFPKMLAKRLGFTEKQLLPSFIVAKIGNPYSASSLIGLAAVLDEARENELIFLTSYGSGAGADAQVYRVLKGKRESTVKKKIKDKEYISYDQYLKITKKLKIEN